MKIQTEGFTFTEPTSLELYSRTDFTLLCTLEELTAMTLDNTEETVNVPGKNEQPIFTVDRNKAVTGSGTSGYISGGLAAIQTGKEVAYGKFNLRKRQTFNIEAGVTTVTLDKAAVGTAGSEILNLSVTVDDVTTKYEQATTADSTKFSYANSTITLPTSVTGGGEVVVVYEYEEEGATIVNSGAYHGTTVYAVLNLLGTNACDEVYRAQLTIPRCKLNANWSWDFAGDGTQHPFEFTALKDICKTNSDSSGDNFWELKIFKSAA